MTPLESLRYFVRHKYAWPGGYPMYVVCDDGAALCHSCVKSNYRQVLAATRRHYGEGWECVGVDINYEDGELYCAHCDARIESAYAEDSHA